MSSERNRPPPAKPAVPRAGTPDGDLWAQRHTVTAPLNPLRVKPPLKLVTLN